MKLNTKPAKTAEFKQRFFTGNGSSVAVPASGKVDQSISINVNVAKGQGIRVLIFGTVSTTLGDAFMMVCPLITLLFAGPGGQVVMARSQIAMNPSGLPATTLSQTPLAVRDEFEVTADDLPGPSGGGVGAWTVTLFAEIENQDAANPHTPNLSVGALVEYYSRLIPSE